MSVSAAVCVVSLADCAVSLAENPRSQQLFLRAFTAQSDAKPVEPVLGLLTSRRRPFFSSPFLLSLLTHSLLPAVEPTFFLSLPLTFTTNQSPFVSSNLWELVGRFVPLGFLHHLPHFRWNFCGSIFRSRYYLISSCFYSISPVLDYLVYPFKDTF
jgi:hypothetical protein